MTSTDRTERDAYWQVPVTDYVSAGAPTDRAVFETREQLDEVWAATIARFRVDAAEKHPKETTHV